MVFPGKYKKSVGNLRYFRGNIREVREYFLPLMGILGEVIQNAKGGGVLIPIIFLGIQANSSFLKLVREKLGEQSAFLSKEGFFAGEEDFIF